MSGRLRVATMVLGTVLGSAALTLGLLAAPLGASAQQAGRVYRLGVLSSTAPTPSDPTEASSRISTALRELGYVEGQNLVVERRFAEGNLDRLPGLARDLVQRRVDVIVTVGTEAGGAARAATTTIPIVLSGGPADPVAAGFVASLARPGGNITGVLLSAGVGLAGKRLELIKEAVPRAARIAVLSTGESASRTQVQEAQKAASSLRVKLVVVDVRAGDYDRAFAAMGAERPGALFVVGSPILGRDRKRIIELAAKHRLPAIYQWREHAEEGGLMAYGSSLFGLSQRVAAYVDRIFKGAKPADLPVEQPTTFELSINLRTAKSLGLTIPPLLLFRADRVIE